MRRYIWTAAVLAFAAVLGCAGKQPTHTVAVYIVDSGTPKITATDKDDVGCKTWGFCGPYAYRLESGKRVCYGPDYRVDVLTDPAKHCYTEIR